jgi:hypothetical protein
VISKESLPARFQAGRGLCDVLESFIQKHSECFHLKIAVVGPQHVDGQALERDSDDFPLGLVIGANAGQPGNERPTRRWSLS